MTRENSLSTYEINIGGRTFSIDSSDEKKHIVDIEKKLEFVFDQVGEKELNSSFSRATAKAALLLADEVIRKNSEEDNKKKSYTQRINNMLEELENALKI